MSAPPCFVDSFYLPLKHVAIVLQAYFSLEHKLQGEGDEIGEELLQPARPAGMGAVRGSQGPTAGAVAEQGGPGCRGTDSLLVSLEVQHQLVEGQVAVRGVGSHLLLLAYCTKEGEKLTAGDSCAWSVCAGQWGAPPAPHAIRCPQPSSPFPMACGQQLILTQFYVYLEVDGRLNFKINRVKELQAVGAEEKTFHTRACSWSQPQGCGCLALRYLQPGPCVAISQGPSEEGCHVFDGYINGIVLLELHLTLLYGQVADLDAKSKENPVRGQPSKLGTQQRALEEPQLHFSAPLQQQPQQEIHLCLHHCLYHPQTVSHG